MEIQSSIGSRHEISHNQAFPGEKLLRTENHYFSQIMSILGNSKIQNSKIHSNL